MCTIGIVRIHELNECDSDSTASEMECMVISSHDLLAQSVYGNMLALMKFLNATMGECEFENGTIKCSGTTLASQFKKADIRNLKHQLACITSARHWYYHHTDDTIVFADILEAMHGVVATVCFEKRDTDFTCPECVLQPLHPSVTAKESNHVKVKLRPLHMGMSIPVPRVRSMVGREKIVASLSTWLTEERTAPRVLLHGIPGVGKDTVAAAVVHDTRIQYSGKYCGQCVVRLECSLLVW